MAWMMLLLGLLVYGSGVDSETVVTQEPSLSVSSGGTVILTCGLSSGSVSTSNYPSWYQQIPGQAPRMLIYSTNTCPSGVPESLLWLHPWEQSCPHHHGGSGRR
uniref:Immunoglobulin lambda variable 8-61 n=1 Tax=Chlorocebus sabaeus TaxID=60711 RepID=A0A0D9RMQ9_CHLSB